jgi:hypothetical protein
MRHSLVLVLVLWAGVSSAFAQEVVKEFSWSELKKAGQLLVGEIVPGKAPGMWEALKIDSPVDQWDGHIPDRKRKTVTVLDLKNPPVTKARYAFEGSIRYKDVKGFNMIAMWSSFASGQKYAGPALPFGDMGEIDAKKHKGFIPFTQGTSDWRPFTLWSFSKKRDGMPTRVTLDVEFSGPGTVYLSPVTLRQYDAPSRPPQPATPWWSDQTAGWIGGIVGSVCGLLGGLIGILGGLGRARRFVMTLTTGLIGLGVASLIAGVVAVILGQPYAVYYPLLLLGGILAGVCGGILPALRRGYEQRELRRMAAMDAR